MIYAAVTFPLCMSAMGRMYGGERIDQFATSCGIRRCAAANNAMGCEDREVVNSHNRHIEVYHAQSGRRLESDKLQGATSKEVGKLILAFWRKWLYNYLQHKRNAHTVVSSWACEPTEITRD